MYTSIYTLTMALLTIIMFSKSMYSEFSNLNTYSFVLIVLVLYISITLIYTNICLLANKKNITISYKINIIISIIQIFYIQLFGFCFHFISTSELSACLVFSTNVDLMFNANIYNGSVEIAYGGNISDLVLGINFVSLFKYFIYKKSYRDYLNQLAPNASS